MSTLAYAVSDSATMLRRNLRHMRRYPVTLMVGVGVPVVSLLLFVYVFGGTLGAGLGGPAAGPAAGRADYVDYVDYVPPAVLLLALTGAAQGTAISALRGLLLGTPIGSSAAVAVAWCLAIALAGHLVALAAYHRNPVQV